MKIHNIFLITGNAGQGKTTTARNLAYVLRILGYDVLVVDGDLKTPKLQQYVGTPLPERTIQDVLLGKRTLRSAIYRGKTGVKFLLSNIRAMQTPHPSRLVPRICDLAEIVLIDVPPQDNNWHNKRIPALVVTQADFPSIININKLCKEVNAKHIILNKLRSDFTELTKKNIEEFCACNILGSIDDKKEVHEANHAGFSVLQTCPENKASRDFKQIAANLMNLKYKPFIEKPFMDVTSLIGKLGL